MIFSSSFLAHPFSTPIYEILQFAKENGMEGKVHIVTCGISNQSQEIIHALTDCMQSGYWFVLQNAHLGEAWTPEMLELLKVLLASCSIFK